MPAARARMARSGARGTCRAGWPPRFRFRDPAPRPIALPHMIRLDHREPVPEACAARSSRWAISTDSTGPPGRGRRGDRWARAEGRPAIVATFDPHPVRHFKPDAEPFRLTTLDQRQELFAAAGADAMLVFHFDGQDCGDEPAEDWVARHDRSATSARPASSPARISPSARAAGNSQVLRDLAAINTACGTRAVAAVHWTMAAGLVQPHPRCAESGRLRKATRLLTRPFAIRGTVQHGDKLGRTIGFPTANLDIGATCARAMASMP
jgi:riboflavin kinase/FMN adenylyltransferase